MTRSVQFQIPKPCHEDWDKMTEAQQGRFCSSCSKIVVDFSMLSDAQVLAWFSKAPTGVCGKFMGEQLNRELVPPRERKPGWLRHLMALLFPAMLLSNRSSGQKVHFTGDTIVSVVPQGQLSPTTKGRVYFRPKVDPILITLKGRVMDEKGKPMIGATVMIKGSIRETTTDRKGSFTLEYLDADRVTLVASFIGYESQEFSLDTRGKKRMDFIMIPMIGALMGDVIVVGKVSSKEPD